MSVESWKHKDIWTRRGKMFAIEISRHYGTEDEYEGPHRWAVYAYIYPSHPHFSKFDGPNLWQDATQVLPFHRGCSYLDYPVHDGKVTCVKIGADYHHLHDIGFTHCATADDAYRVFSDADELFDRLTAMAETEVIS
ncbi:hypothetical protein [Paraburkholderia sp. J11-2]|uniref:hypothetical protein n=1 Tax=Paraburkholderia sp. J11-2 TaxID=2805431 RepID=UPI002AB6348A|nr:hypothetical protein [Paraburkholderia sp. J11-2]